MITKKTKTGKLDRRFNCNRPAIHKVMETRANTRRNLYIGAVTLGLLFGMIVTMIVYNATHKTKITPKSLSEVTEVKAYEIPCDRDAITYVRCKGEQLGYTEYQITTFQAIARCESNHNPMAKNKNSTATGIYQFINSTFHAYCAGKNVYDFKDNIDCFYKVLEVNGMKGLNHWNASKSCWGK